MPPLVSSEEDIPVLREHDARLARLLTDAEAACGPVAWPRVESVITALVELYGAGLERLLASARDAASSTSTLDDLLVGDELVSSLLLLHGLHPVPLERRLDEALARLRIEEPHAAALSVVEIVDGVVRLRLEDPNAPLPPPPGHAVARASERHAPELAGIHIEPAGPPRGPGLVPAAHLVRSTKR